MEGAFHFVPWLQHCVDHLWLHFVHNILHARVKTLWQVEWMANTTAGPDGLGGQLRQIAQPIGSKY